MTRRIIAVLAGALVFAFACAAPVLAAEPTLTLIGKRTVVLPRSKVPAMHMVTLLALRHAGVTPHVVQEAIEVPTLLSLVAAGVGVFLPIQFFSRLSLPGVVYRPIGDAPVVEIVAVWSRQHGSNSVIKAWLAVAQDVIAGQDLALV